MANNVQIYPTTIAPYAVWLAGTTWNLGSEFQATGSGSGWSVGADLGPTAYADNGSGAVRVTMADTSTLATGNSIIIAGTTSSVYDGFWIVTVIDATHIDLVGSTYSVNPAAKGTLKETLRYNWLVVGWRTLSEDDLNDAYPLNSVRTGYGYSIADAVIYENNMNGKRPANANDELYLTWTLPERIRFHHISIYYQTSAAAVVTYDPTTLASKVLPGSTAMTALYDGALDGNIPGTATRTIISSPTAHAYTRQVPILAKDLANNIVTIFGDYRHVFANGAALVLLDSGTDSGATTVSGNPTVDYTSNGEVTLVTVAANIADATLGQLQFNVGPFKPNTDRGTCTLNITEDLQLNPKPLAELDYRGVSSDTDYLRDNTDDGLTLQIPMTGFSSADDLYLLNKWRKRRTPVTILQTSEDGVIAFQHLWTGRILVVPDTGGVRKHASGSRSIQLLLDSQVDYREDFKWFAINTATAADNSITISGDVRKFIGQGTPLYIRNSTGNDGLWAVSSITYSITTDLTTIIFTGSLPDNTDDGYVEVYDW